VDDGQGATLKFFFAQFAYGDCGWRSHGCIRCNQSTGFTTCGRYP
jgi:hypothetical protein